MKPHSKLTPVRSKKDIPSKYKNNPIGSFLEYHNLGKKFDIYSQAQLLIGMCMDNRKHLSIPDNFAYIVRSAGANLRYSEFKISYAIGVGGVSHIALIGHTHCGMENLNSRRDVFVSGLVQRAGWDKQTAQDHFMNLVMMFEIGDVSGFILSEASRLQSRYPKILVAPMLYKLEDNQVYLLGEK